IAWVQVSDRDAPGQRLAGCWWRTARGAEDLDLSAQFAQLKADLRVGHRVCDLTYRNRDNRPVPRRSLGPARDESTCSPDLDGDPGSRGRRDLQSDGGGASRDRFSSLAGSRVVDRRYQLLTWRDAVRGRHS